MGDAASFFGRTNQHFGIWEKKYWGMEFRPLGNGEWNLDQRQPFGNESSPFCRTEWFHVLVKIEFFHLTRVFCLLVKVVGSYAVYPGSIPGSSQLRQKCDVRQKLQILKFLKLESLNPILKSKTKRHF